MSVVIFARYNNIGEALADQSCLMAGGYSVGFHNFFHASNDYFVLQALGGLILTISEEEYAEARSFLRDMKRHPLQDEDPKEEKRYGYWGRAMIASGLLMGPFLLLLPIFFILPELLFTALLLLSGILVWLGETIWITFLPIPTFLVIILLDTKYIALPKLRRTNTV